MGVAGGERAVWEEKDEVPQAQPIEEGDAPPAYVAYFE